MGVSVILVGAERQTKRPASPLREVREFADETIERGAKVIAVSFGTLWNFENGKSTPTEQQLESLMAFYSAKINARVNRVRELIGVEAA